MTSDRQLQTNRLNAVRSTGPRSQAGMRRSSQNAFRHGLSGDLRAIRPEAIELLARQLAGDRADLRMLEYARSLAHAAIALERVRQTKRSFIERIVSVGRLHRSYTLTQIEPIIFTKPEMRQIDGAFSAGRMPRLRRLRTPKPLPRAEPARTAEAFRRALPELVMIDRYARQAFARYHRALREMLRIAAGRFEMGGR